MTKKIWLPLLVIASISIGFLVGQKFNRLRPVCPQDFKDASKSTDTYLDWWNNFVKENPHATYENMSEARRNFYVKHGCAYDLKLHDDIMSWNINEY